MILLVIFAFLAGIVTVLSPCILPVLPIVLSGSVTGGKQRPLGIMTGFVLSFTFFTLFLSTIVRATGISAEVLRNVSIVIIGVFGLFLLFPQAQALFEKLFQQLARFSPQQTGDGFGSGLLVGLSLGLLWTPCVGPILAAIISLALSGTVTGSAVFITVAYAVGTALPMTAIIYGGRNLLNRIPWLLNNTARIQRGFGVVMILTALAIFMNWDRQFQTWVLTQFPQYGTGLTQFEDIEIIHDQLDRLQPGNQDENSAPMGKPLFEMQGNTQTLPQLGAAPEIIPGGQWFNSEPLTLQALENENKVVLIDFWTYSCINCIRTLPYLKEWHEKYSDQGLVIIGVHAPEFEFEKDAKNVAEAIADFEIQYPVVQDNDFATWRAYNNRYWPAKYLIDANGVIRYTHFGEGEYAETENAIRELLGEEPMATTTTAEQPTRRRQTPELYLGYGRASAYVQAEQLRFDATTELSATGTLPEESVELDGSWYLAEEYILSSENEATLSLNFLASEVFLVLESTAGPQTVQVLLDGKPLPEKYMTADMSEPGVLVVDEARKYDIVDLGEDYGRHTLTLKFAAGIQAFAFTFGSN
ncbi:cytochrome c biogenesis protein DipZ [Candidatus Woesebacteria bacterium]|nr:cytochrome c biogenesis protein DipZ [Candidatus Woesebacteria bacterium]MCD8507114.1 cytochrome c biogenesis protein DipZ [Candidatus Woesebacteria bacterium]MCD8526915.1 cytochrome c biogenesis protein DipZ [Candidatus Woesebacteria bacterium]MCD8546064.1 cytochrome c biogenesis protein DipZ [Candidatus Woesebacteria bacterium]